MFRLQSNSVADTMQIGKRLGHQAMPGAVIALIGDLGVGKTHLAQGIAAGIGVPDHTVTSPTYSLIAEHYGGRIPLYHMDAYRLSDSAELEPIGFDDYVARADGLLVIEWADRISDSLPEDRLEIEMLLTQDDDGGSDSRLLIFQAFGDSALALAQRSQGFI